MSDYTLLFDPSLSLRRSPEEDADLKLPSVTKREEASLRFILKMIRKFTPHMRGSFVLDEFWWEQNHNTSSLHVRLVLVNHS